MGAILKRDFTFKKSHEHPGLQLVDILCNAIRRAMNGNLGKHGWELIGCLSVQAEKGKHVIQVINLSSGASWTMKPEYPPYGSVIRLVDKMSRPMLRRGLLEEHGYAR